MPTDSILKIKPLGFPWETIDPFLTCVYHEDAYPRANGRMGPDAPLAGRELGRDFSRKDGWSMYHGESIPGFPAHLHRGFETVTIVRKGLIDHSDSLGAAARYGHGDVQWLTAGGGVVHSEMFPLLDPTAPNPLELFQIWLNLPAAAKMSAPYFTMFWSEAIPRRVAADALGRATEITVIAGRLSDAASGAAPAHAEVPPAPPPDSWRERSGSRGETSAVPRKPINAHRPSSARPYSPTTPTSRGSRRSRPPAATPKPTVSGRAGRSASRRAHYAPRRGCMRYGTRCAAAMPTRRASA